MFIIIPSRLKTVTSSFQKNVAGTLFPSFTNLQLLGNIFVRTSPLRNIAPISSNPAITSSGASVRSFPSTQPRHFYAVLFCHLEHGNAQIFVQGLFDGYFNLLGNSYWFVCMVKPTDWRAIITINVFQQRIFYFLLSL